MFFGAPSSSSVAGSMRNEKVLVGKVANVLPGVPRRNVTTEAPLRLATQSHHLVSIRTTNPKWQAQCEHA